MPHLGLFGFGGCTATHWSVWFGPGPCYLSPHHPGHCISWLSHSSQFNYPLDPNCPICLHILTVLAGIVRKGGGGGGGDDSLLITVSPIPFLQVVIPGQIYQCIWVLEFTELVALLVLLHIFTNYITASTSGVPDLIAVPTSPRA